MSVFTTISTMLSLKQKVLTGIGVLVAVSSVVSLVAWKNHQLSEANKSIGSLEQVVRNRDATIADQASLINTLNQAQKAFHSQEIKDDAEQAEYAAKQERRKAALRSQTQSVERGDRRLTADTLRVLQESIREFNADADKG